MRKMSCVQPLAHSVCCIFVGFHGASEHCHVECCHTEGLWSSLGRWHALIQLHRQASACTVGEGEFGIVHKAMWHGTLVAAKILKVSNAIALGDFRSELEVLRKVHHPNAVQFLGACTKQEPYVLVTELMTGGSLSDAMRQQKTFTLRRAMEICIDTARGLAYMHNKRPGAIIHRDLKPGNLMISGSQYHSMYALIATHSSAVLCSLFSCIIARWHPSSKPGNAGAMSCIDAFGAQQRIAKQSKASLMLQRGLALCLQLRQHVTSCCL